MFCPNCGYEFEDENGFCPYCGASLYDMNDYQYNNYGNSYEQGMYDQNQYDPNMYDQNQYQEYAYDQYQQNEYDYENVDNSKKKSSKRPVILALLILVIAFCGSWFALKENPIIFLLRTRKPANVSTKIEERNIIDHKSPYIVIDDYGESQPRNSYVQNIKTGSRYPIPAVPFTSVYHKDYNALVYSEEYTTYVVFLDDVDKGNYEVRLPINTDGVISSTFFMYNKIILPDYDKKTLKYYDLETRRVYDLDVVYGVGSYEMVSEDELVYVYKDPYDESKFICGEYNFNTNKKIEKQIQIELNNERAYGYLTATDYYLMFTIQTEPKDNNYKRAPKREYTHVYQRGMTLVSKQEEVTYRGDGLYSSGDGVYSCEDIRIIEDSKATKNSFPARESEIYYYNGNSKVKLMTVTVTSVEIDRVDIKRADMYSSYFISYAKKPMANINITVSDGVVRRCFAIGDKVFDNAHIVGINNQGTKIFVHDADNRIYIMDTTSFEKIDLGKTEFVDYLYSKYVIYFDKEDLIFNDENGHIRHNNKVIGNVKKPSEELYADFADIAEKPESTNVIYFTDINNNFCSYDFNEVKTLVKNPNSVGYDLISGNIYYTKQNEDLYVLDGETEIKINKPSDGEFVDVHYFFLGWSKRKTKSSGSGLRTISTNNSGIGDTLSKYFIVGLPQKLSELYSDNHFYVDNDMQKSTWVFHDNYYYHVDSSGNIEKDKWIEDRYVGTDGRMYKGRQTPDGKWVGDDGLVVDTGDDLSSSLIIEAAEPDSWYKTQSGLWYYFENDRTTTKRGWFTDERDGQTYYFDPETGIMAVGWTKVDGDEYYFNEYPAEEKNWYETGDGFYESYGKKIKAYGSMFRDELTPDGRKVDANGHLME